MECLSDKFFAIWLCYCSKAALSDKWSKEWKKRKARKKKRKKGTLDEISFFSAPISWRWLSYWVLVSLNSNVTSCEFFLVVSSSDLRALLSSESCSIPSVRFFSSCRSSSKLASSRETVLSPLSNSFSWASRCLFSESNLLKPRQLRREEKWKNNSQFEEERLEGNKQLLESWTQGVKFQFLLIDFLHNFEAALFVFTNILHMNSTAKIWRGEKKKKKLKQWRKRRRKEEGGKPSNISSSTSAIRASNLWICSSVGAKDSSSYFFFSTFCLFLFFCFSYFGREKEKEDSNGLNFLPNSSDGVLSFFEFPVHSI